MEKLSRAQRLSIIGRLVVSKDGRAKLAASLQQPLRTERDYYSIGRKIMFVEDLPDGIAPIYDKDVSVRAYFISDTGEELVSVLTPKNVTVPLFEIVSAPKIPLKEIQDRRYDVVLRAKDKGRSEINREEDYRVFAALTAIAEDATNPNTVISASSQLLPSDFSDAFGQIEAQDLVVSTIALHPRDYADLRKFDRDVLDPTSQRELLKSGIMAAMWGAQVVVSTQVEQGKVLVLAEPEFVGRMPVRADIAVLSADDPANRMIGFSMFERLGILCFNPKATQEISITRT